MPGYSVLVERAMSEFLQTNAATLLQGLTLQGQELVFPYPSSHPWGMSMGPLTLMVNVAPDTMGRVGANAGLAAGMGTSHTVTLYVVLPARQDRREKFLFERCATLRDILVMRIVRLLATADRIFFLGQPFAIDTDAPITAVNADQYVEADEESGEDAVVLIGAAVSWTVETGITSIDPFDAEVTASLLREE